MLLKESIKIIQHSLKIDQILKLCDFQTIYTIFSPQVLFTLFFFVVNMLKKIKSFSIKISEL